MSRSSKKGKEKFVIKPFRPEVIWDKRKADTTWVALSKAIAEIHNQNASSLSFEELYRNAYNLVLHKHGDLLYNGVTSVVDEYLKNIGNNVADANESTLLTKLESEWNTHQTTMVMIRDILMYMDRTFVKQTKKTPIYMMGLNKFNLNVSRHKDVKERLQTLILSNIAKERAGEQIDFVLIKNILLMLIKLGAPLRDNKEVYQQDFEHSFLMTSKTFYHEESLKYLTENTCPAYMKKAEDRLVEEKNRVSRYLHESTGPKLMRIVEGALIYRHAQSLVDMENSGCIDMFRNNKIDDLARLYRLFNRVPETLRHVEKCMKEYIVEVGKSYVKDQEEDKDPVKFIDNLLNMRDKYSNIVSSSFNGDKLLEKCMKDSFEEFMNVDSRCAQFLSQYCDNMLKRKLKGLSEREVDDILAKVIILFRYLQDRDVFNEYYRRNLAKRLLQGRSASDDAEKIMIGKLKAECGYQFTQQLEGMFTDIRLSRQTANSFTQACPPNDGDEVELTVKVLTSGFWPQKQVPPCSLPSSLKKLSDRFEDFYLQQHQGRRIAWQCGMGMADVSARFGSKRYELSVTTYQMCILMLFNEATSFTFEDIVAKTKIPRNECKLHLVSMTLKKYQLFTKEPKSKSVNDNDVFTVNAKYKSKLIRVRVPLVTVKQKAKASVPKSVQEDRRQLVEAAIVRIMKTRTRLEHNELVGEVSKQLSTRFTPSPSDVKKRIESLIDREYLERSEDDRRVYNYLA